MSIQTFEVDRSKFGTDSSLRGGQFPKREFAAAWIKTLADTGRFFLARKGAVIYLAVTDPLDHFVQIVRWQEFRAIIEAGEAVTVTCPRHEMHDGDWQELWHLTSIHRFRLPPAGNRYALVHS